MIAMCTKSAGLSMPILRIVRWMIWTWRINIENRIPPLDHEHSSFAHLTVNCKTIRQAHNRSDNDFI